MQLAFAKNKNRAVMQLGFCLIIGPSPILTVSSKFDKINRGLNFLREGSRQ